MSLSTLDIGIFAAYVVGLIAIATFVSREKEGHDKDTKDYFLAGNSLTWWAIGASLIAANISAEQIIGMSGSGYAVGIGIASYEWLAAITLMIVGKYFLPIFLKHRIYTMPQYLERRYNHDVRLVMAIFWIGVYIFVNLTSVLWLGALAINTVADVDIFYGLIFLGAFAAAYSLYGGLKAVAFTDIIQVVLLVAGGFYLSYITLNIISEDAGVLAGFSKLMALAPEKFDMILSADNEYYELLPGITSLVGAVWVLHFAYWGFNQYITQRALGAKSIKEAQKGVMFAAYLKLLMPLVIVLPGICAAILFPVLEKSDQAYPTMMSLLPNGLLGLTFAALIAAIVSSLASMTNSISTIFTMDIYRSFSNNHISESKLINIGRNAVVISLLTAVIVAKPLLGSFDSIFQYIQNFTGLFTPGILVIFLVALFWKKATTLSTLVAAISSLVLSIFISYILPELPYIHRMGIVFFVSAFACYITTLLQGYQDQAKAIDLKGINFSTSRAFNINAVIIVGILALIYGIFA